MRRLLALILLFSSCFAFGQTAMFSSSVTLGDGERCVMPLYYDSNPCEEQETAIAETYYQKLMDNTLLRALGLEEYSNTLSWCLKESISDIYDSNKIEEYFFVYHGLSDFLLKIGRNAKVRKILSDTAIDLVCDLCKYYPKDFKETILCKVKECKNFVDTISRHTYASNYDQLYIDGKASPDDAYGIKGFIIRRVLDNSVPADEFAQILDKLYSRVNGVDVSANKDILRSVYINNELTYNTTVKGNYYSINKTGLSIKPYFMDSPWSSRFQHNLVQCFVGDDGVYYKIVAYSVNYDYRERNYVINPTDNLIIIDNQGNIIYQEIPLDEEEEFEDYEEDY